MSIVDCCYNCTERHFNCHSTCREYKKKTLANDIMKAKRHKEVKADSDYRSFRNDSYARYLRHNK